MSILNKDSRAASDRARTEEVRAEFEDALAKIDTIEEGAEVNQTDAEIKTQYEANADTNAFTDAEKTLLGNQSGVNSGDEVAASLTVEGIVELATIAEIDTGTDGTRAVTPAGLAGSALATKVSGIEEGATADQSDAEIKTAYEANADTNAFTDAEQTTVGILAAVPTTDPGDGVTVWNDAGVLKVTPI